MWRSLARSHDQLALETPGALIELRQVVKRFHNAAGEFTALDQINAAFQPGEFASIVGRSGSGKSTLLNMVTGIDRPTSGTVRVGRVLLNKMNEGGLSIWRGKNMGIVFQFFQLLPMLTLLENTMLPMDFYAGIPPAEREPRARELLWQVGLRGLEHKYPAAVSGGQQQTAAVARALANDPPILVADEPTGNLDQLTAERVLEIFEQQAATGKTVLMVTHDFSLARRARRILVISDGELIPEEISNVFPGLSHDLLHQVSRAARRRRYQPGETIWAGSEAPELLLVRSGRVDVIVSGLLRTQVAARKLSQGDLFSRLERDMSKQTMVGLKADGEVEVLEVERLPGAAELQDTLAAAARSHAGSYARAARQRGEKGLINGR